MHLARFVRTKLSFVILGLAGSVIGCSGGPSAPPPDRETAKKIAADTKAAHAEAKAARAEAIKGRQGAMRGRMKGGGD